MASVDAPSAAVFAERRRDLVAALRSGEYRHVKHSLRTADGMCAAGVACQLSGLGHWDASHRAYILPGLPSLSVESLGWRRVLIEHYGLDSAQLWRLTKLNDEASSYEPAAAYLESLDAA